MSGWLLASYIALWILVCVLGVAMLALYNHFGQMYLASREGRSAHGPPEGGPLPSTDARDVHDRPVRIPGPGRQAVLLFASTDCPLCNELKPDLGRFAEAHRECDVVVICTGEGSAVRDWSRDLPEVIVVVPDRKSRVAASYRIGLTPFLVVTSTSGVVLARGLVNNHQDLEMALSLARGGDGAMIDVHTAVEA